MRKYRCPITLWQKGGPTYCYFFLIFWIIIFTTGLYWLLTEAGIKGQAIPSSQNVLHSPGDDLSDLYADTAMEVDDFASEIEAAAKSDVLQSSKSDLKEAKIGEKPPPKMSDVERLCNRKELIKAKDEYFYNPDFKLEAVMVLFRHGDRGPLSHLGRRNISYINCRDSHPEYLDLIQFMGDMGKMPGYSQFIGPFHSFPRVPTPGGCTLGQLTATGVIQLLTLGKLMRTTYDSSGLFGNGSIPNVKVTSYATRYRRTFQSLLAFLYGLMGPQAIVPSVTIAESQSTAFCFNHCSCRAAEGLKKEAVTRTKHNIQDKQEMSSLVSELNTLLELGKVKKTGASLLDSLLIYQCHNSPLPCRRKRRQLLSNRRDCVTFEKLQRLIDLIELENQGIKETPEQHKHALLSSYGLIKELLNMALRMTSSGQPGEQSQSRSRLAVFSGHDKTLQGLLGALGVVTGHTDLNLLPYASRLIIEIYRIRTLPENSPRKHFLRFVYNGEAITHLIDFCHDSYVANEKNGQAVDLCPLESLVRFFHDSYFDPFPKGVVNFKDACHL